MFFCYILKVMIEFVIFIFSNLIYIDKSDFIPFSKTRGIFLYLESLDLTSLFLHLQ